MLLRCRQPVIQTLGRLRPILFEQYLKVKMANGWSEPSTNSVFHIRDGKCPCCSSPRLEVIGEFDVQLSGRFDVPDIMCYILALELLLIQLFCII